MWMTSLVDPDERLDHSHGPSYPPYPPHGGPRDTHMPEPLVHTPPTPPASPEKRTRWDDSPNQPSPSQVRPARQTQREGGSPSVPPFPFPPGKPPRRPSLLEEEQHKKKRRDREKTRISLIQRLRHLEPHGDMYRYCHLQMTQGKMSLVTQT